MVWSFSTLNCCPAILITAIIILKIRTAKVRGNIEAANGKSKIYEHLLPYQIAPVSVIFAGLIKVSIELCMKIKSFLAKPFASYIYKGVRKGMLTAVTDQENILKSLIKTGRITDFGKESGFAKVNSYYQRL